ncbi:MAG: DVUA0089 family protein [Geitlerinemataceae cyanobacterium]
MGAPFLYVKLLIQKSSQAVDAGTTEIWGNLSADADLFAFAWDGGFFSASTNNAGTSFDTQLFLFDSAGFGIAGADGTGFLTLPSTLSISDLAAGEYFLGISDWDNDPVSVGGEIFTDEFVSQQTPTGPGGGSPLTSWDGRNANAFDGYQIVLSSATGGDEVASTPEPAALLGLISIASIGFSAKRKQRS